MQRQQLVSCAWRANLCVTAVHTHGHTCVAHASRAPRLGSLGLWVQKACDPLWFGRTRGAHKPSTKPGVYKHQSLHLCLLCMDSQEPSSHVPHPWEPTTHLAAQSIGSGRVPASLVDGVCLHTCLSPLGSETVSAFLWLTALLLHLPMALFSSWALGAGGHALGLGQPSCPRLSNLSADPVLNRVCTGPQNSSLLFSAGESSSFLDKYPLRFSSGNIIVCSLTEKKGSATQCQGTLLHSGGVLTHPSPSYLSFYKCVDLSSGMFHLLCHFLTANCVRRPLKGRDFVSFFTHLI